MFVTKLYIKMKKIVLLLGLFVGIVGYSQEKQATVFPRNEIKGNALFLVLGALEVTYEHLITEESGFGSSISITATDDFQSKFAITPFYRFYFGRKPAAGFFVEGFGSLNSYEDENFFDIFSSWQNKYSTVKRTDFALGFGLGAKWLTRTGFVFEINGGVGRNLFNSSDTDFQIIGRGGVTVGYRF
jgi:hypothetical protein